MKLTFASQHVAFEVEPVDHAAMKAHPELYPFLQCPRLVDGEYDIVQSNAILRYLARKYKLYGKDEHEAIAVDMIMEGVESLRVKYLNLIYQDKLEPEAKAVYWKTHGDPETAEGRNGGAHLRHLSRLLARNTAGAGKAFVGSSLSMADLCAFDVLDLHSRIFGEELKAAYPDLATFHAHVAALPGVKEYLAGPQRVAAVNGNSLG
ncbi:hypothetical protein HYH03_016639 [Edaphochlamys debaryana]|uniref:glutathione transferase n=1 Tax=Edaphochlamys debaryana TaxID=47281 RepID=A0A835XKQ9_9CHLO|nr:hypothetical protein HYH03_016639 [Edaphochlamys debaryana]|eukprot:KAG2484598.1 hypothetical protein HYH03_016639 [Edaphochlamys debaryana]